MPGHDQSVPRMRYLEVTHQAALLGGEAWNGMGGGICSLGGLPLVDDSVGGSVPLLALSTHTVSYLAARISDYACGAVHTQIRIPAWEPG
jgi:hypothetical protein